MKITFSIILRKYVVKENFFIEVQELSFHARVIMTRMGKIKRS